MPLCEACFATSSASCCPSCAWQWMSIAPLTPEMAGGCWISSRKARRTAYDHKIVAEDPFAHRSLGARFRRSTGYCLGSLHHKPLAFGTEQYHTLVASRYLIVPLLHPVGNRW